MPNPLSIPAMLGMKYSMLTVLRQAPSKNGRPCVTVQCDCGTLKTMLAANIRHSRSKSCGCQRGRKAATDKQPNIAAYLDGEPFSYNGKVYQMVCLTDDTNLTIGAMK